MKLMRSCMVFLRSTTLTIWLVGLFLLSYLTVAVWSKEALGFFIMLLSSNNLFRFAYLVFFLNVTLRSVTALIILWPARARFFLRMPLYIGLVIFLFSFAMSVNIRQTKWILVGEGDIPDIPWEQNAFQVAHVESALEKKALRTEESLIFDYEPTLTVTDRNGVHYAIGAFPPRRALSTFMHVLNFGIGPGVELRKKDVIVARGEVALRLIPFGSVDTFDMPPFPYKFYLSLLPNRVIKKGKEIARDYDLEKPRYGIEIVKGEKVIAKGETDTQITFDRDMSLTFYKPANWVQLEVVHDPFLIGLGVGYALIFIGLISYVLEIVVFRSAIQHAVI